MSADPHGLPLAEVERREREERRIVRVGRAICEAEFDGLCVCEPVFGARCRRPMGVIRKQAIAAIAAYPEPDVSHETTR